MARPKDDGRGRLGGRAKGTPNRATATLKDWVGNLIDKNRKQVERDLRALEPKDRLAMIEKLLQYVMPKQQAVKAEVDYSNLSDAQLDLIVDELWERSNADGEGDADGER